MIRRGWMDISATEPVPAVTLPAADFDRLLALLEECADAIDLCMPIDLPRRVRALLKDVGDG